MSDRVYIFDTTLRDGEQSPGCSMDTPEKLLMARKLVELGVDILEAGFPIASEGDFEAVDAVSREFGWVQIAALARCCTLDVERAAKSLCACQAAADPHLHRDQRHPPEVQAEEDAAAGAGRSGGGGGTGAPVRGRRGILGGRRRAHGARIPGEDLEGGGGCRARAR